MKNGDIVLLRWNLVHCVQLMEDHGLFRQASQADELSDAFELTIIRAYINAPSKLARNIPYSPSEDGGAGCDLREVAWPCRCGR
jgi:hypothetical protein